MSDLHPFIMTMEFRVPVSTPVAVCPLLGALDCDDQFTLFVELGLYNPDTMYS